jgi:Fe2+ transport system protein FeoA
LNGTGSVLEVNGSTLALGSAARIDIGYNGTDVGNSVIISNGALVTSSSSANNLVNLGISPGAKSNLYQVGGEGLSSTVTNSYVVVGVAAAANDNRMIVTNATLTTTYTTQSTIGMAGSTNNTATITAGGVWNCARLDVGTATSISNVLYVLNGGVLQHSTAYSITIGAGAGNMITNSGGVYQFTNATPGITLGGVNKMYLTDGTISFLNIASGLNMTNNFGSTGVGAITYSGNNTLRLNNSTATNTAAAYKFDSFVNSGDAKVYKGLEMIGGSRITGKGITIGAGGSILFSNNTTTAATIDGVFTNSGTMTVVDSLVTFATNCVLQGGGIVWSTNAASSNLITVAGSLTTSGSISIDATKATAGNPPRVTLFTVTGAIANNAAWAVTPSPYTVKIDGTELILSKSTAGTVIMFR